MSDTTTGIDNGASSAAGGSPGQGQDFIRAIVADDLRSGRHDTVVTRFPPEPNGYLHVGHAKSIVLNFGIAAENGGRCHLRFDDTNPETEDVRYVESIQDTVRWLGYDWGEHLFFASDYFPEMYALAEFLIGEGNAYVDSSTEEEIRDARGSVTSPGRPTRYRDRSPEENLELFRRMRAGEFPNGSQVLRAKIDLASSNMLLRDPILYRVRHAHHYRTGDQWCIYPLYDYAHPIEDAIERVTHSICTLEFENNRPLYDWVVEAWLRMKAADAASAAADTERLTAASRPHQYEFARGNLEYTVMSKRKLLELVKGEYVSGWDDPRMPTLAGMRRRGVTPEAIRSFWEGVGVTKVDNRIDVARLEHAIRDDLNQKAPRVLCVLRPLRVVITNYPDNRTEELEAPLYPHDVPKEGSRLLPFSREIYIDRDDFMEDPPKGFFRLSPGGDVRLRYAYIIRCDEVVKDQAGEVVELRCSYYPETRGGASPEGRTVKGTIQWVSAPHAVRCEVRLYDRLFSIPDPDAGEGDFKDYLNRDSLVVVEDAVIEPSVRADEPGSHYQFERVGYFYSDPTDSTADAPVFNRTVTLRDTWAKRAQTPAPARQGRREKRLEGRVDRAGSEGEAVVAATETGGVSLPEYVGSSSRRVQVPELEPRAVRYTEELGIAREDAELLIRDQATSDLFEAALDQGAPARSIANWVIHELPRELGGRSVDQLPFGGRELGRLVGLVEDGTLSSSAGREVLAVLATEGGEPEQIVERLGLRQLNDASALVPAVDAVLAANAAKAEEYRGGKSGLLGFFVGQVMRQTGGKANPELVRDLLQERLGG